MVKIHAAPMIGYRIAGDGRPDHPAAVDHRRVERDGGAEVLLTDERRHDGAPHRCVQGVADADGQDAAEDEHPRRVVGAGHEGGEDE